MSSLRKAAIFLVSIGAKAASLVYKYLSDDEIERVSTEIARLDNVTSHEVTSVNEEFYHMILAQEYISTGGLSYAREVLEEALGSSRALDIIRRIESIIQVRGFNVLENVDTNQLLAFLQKEHPQTIALVLSQLTPTQAATILSDIPPSTQIDVMHRIAKMERVSPETLKSVEKVLETHIDFGQETSMYGGVKAASEILNMLGQRFEKSILTGIAKEDSELAVEIKNLMFVFDDIITLDDRSIQKIVKEVDTRELAMALKACSEEVKNKILSNMSTRASDMIKEEIEYMGPVRLREVEEVQQRIIDVVRNLEEEGEIVITAGGESDQLV